MITEISIKDLGVIANATLPLGAGFTAITGETGAGKTMVVTALGLLMGHRSDAALVRTGAEQARVGGVLVPVADTERRAAVAELVADAGGEIEENELLVTRTVTAAGPSRASVGGTRAPVGVLTQLASHFFCVHGQADQLRLRSQAEQRDTLDRFGGHQLEAALTVYRAAHTRHAQLTQEYRELTENREARRREAARLRAETAEIMEVDPQPDETQEIAAQLAQLENAAEIRVGLADALNALTGEDDYQTGVETLLGRAQRAVENAAATGESARLDAAGELLTQALELVQQAATEIVGYSDSFETVGPEDLDAAQQRLAQLRTLERNYGPELSDVIVYLETASTRLLNLEDDDTRIPQLETELRDAAAAQQTAAAQLTELRQRASTQLATAVTAELKALALPESELLVRITPAEPSKHGADEIEFLLVPHAGATPRPLAKAASGGELSRIMLALEVVLANVDPVPTFVFDEIDAGIGGAAAIEVGKRLARLAQQAQVIVVTHLPQVAAFATNHLRVVKDLNGAFTESSCQRLEGQQRLEEIARLLSGLSGSESALAHAAELLTMGENIQA